MEYLLHLDREIFLYLNNLGTPTWDWFWIFITNKWSSIPLYAFLIFLLYKKIGLRTTILALVLIAGMITCTDQLANVFKDGFMRLRPCNLDLDARFLMDYCGGYGFFSAHACSSMALAIFVGSILKRYFKYAMPGMLFWSFLLGYSRIYVGKHYPGDVVVGFMIGAIIGTLFYQLLKLIVRYYKTQLKYSFTKA